MESYKDFYGCTAYIRTAKSGRARLTIFTGTHLIFVKTYQTYRGAKIAMGKQSDCWRRIA